MGRRPSRPARAAVRREPVLRQQRHRRRPAANRRGQGDLGAQLAVQGTRPAGRADLRPAAADPQLLGGCLLPVRVGEQPPAGRGQLLQSGRPARRGRRADHPRQRAGRGTGGFLLPWQGYRGARLRTGWHPAALPLRRAGYRLRPVCRALPRQELPGAGAPGGQRRSGPGGGQAGRVHAGVPGGHHRLRFQRQPRHRQRQRRFRGFRSPRRTAGQSDRRRPQRAGAGRGRRQRPQPAVRHRQDRPCAGQHDQRPDHRSILGLGGHPRRTGVEPHAERGQEPQHARPQLHPRRHRHARGVHPDLLPGARRPRPVGADGLRLRHRRPLLGSRRLQPGQGWQLQHRYLR
ncbi:hypothetical protein D9M71_471650 [compost metagenome]